LPDDLLAAVFCIDCYRSRAGVGFSIARARSTMLRTCISARPLCRRSTCGQ
jgi:hypothetical protein